MPSQQDSHMAERGAPSRTAASPLGKTTANVDVYTPSLLHPIPRAEGRERMGLPADLPAMRGEDQWTAYELSWLDVRGRPHNTAVRLTVPVGSPMIVESKSLKLYLNSFAQTRFRQTADVLKTLNSDLSLAFRAPVLVDLLGRAQLGPLTETLPGVCLDEMDVDIDAYERDPELLVAADPGTTAVKETLHSWNFRSLCPVTGQPDWAAVVIEYRGPAIDRAGLYRYLVSYRSHSGFHETTVERIYADLLAHCGCVSLSVWARFMRRGGIDINPFRSTREDKAPVLRLAYQ
ncbi:MAG: NADPH-dependent 7-cyano-7-deazaguanine reductase QueF [Pseudomonadota bacterium]